MNPKVVAQARRLYHHVLHGGTLTPDDVSFMVEALEEAYKRENIKDYDSISERFKEFLHENIEDIITTELKEYYNYGHGDGLNYAIQRVLKEYMTNTEFLLWEQQLKEKNT